VSLIDVKDHHDVDDDARFFYFFFPFVIGERVSLGIFSVTSTQFLSSMKIQWIWAMCFSSLLELYVSDIFFCYKPRTNLV